MKKILQWLLIGMALVVLVACGGGGNLDDNSARIEIQKSFSYDSTNRVTKEDLGNGQYIEYVYDDSGNLISQTVVK